MHDGLLRKQAKAMFATSMGHLSNSTCHCRPPHLILRGLVRTVVTTLNPNLFREPAAHHYVEKTTRRLPSSRSDDLTWRNSGDKMTWKTPKIVEVPVGMEINMYACAARK
jgi:coenzyme PQQ precursor peptide PqqA